MGAHFTLSNILSVLSLFVAIGFGAWIKHLSARAAKATDVQLDAINKRLDEHGKMFVEAMNSDDCAEYRGDHDKSISRIETELKQTTKKVQELDKEQVRFTAFVQTTEKEIKEVKANAQRNSEVMAHQLESIHKKIDRVDEKLDRVRES